MAARTGALVVAAGAGGAVSVLADAAAPDAASTWAVGVAAGVAVFGVSGLRTGVGATTASTLGRAGATSGLRGVSANCLMKRYTLSDWRCDRSIAEGSDAVFAGGNAGNCAWAVKLKIAQPRVAQQARYKFLANG